MDASDPELCMENKEDIPRLEHDNDSVSDDNDGSFIISDIRSTPPPPPPKRKNSMCFYIFLYLN